MHTRSSGRPVMGISPVAAESLQQALSGVQYPAEKWQLIDHCRPDAAGVAPVSHRTIRQLWGIPAARYSNLRQVLRAAARTACGYPRRQARRRQQPVQEPDGHP